MTNINAYQLLQRRILDIHYQAREMEDHQLAIMTFMAIVHCDMKLANQSFPDDSGDGTGSMRAAVEHAKERLNF